MVVETYDYEDATGTILFRVERLEPKSFRQCRPAPDGTWVYDTKGVRKVLYRLLRVLSAKKRGDRIYLVEGERDVHTLERFGRTATTVPGGASKWSANYAKTLRGAKVTIIGDADRAGLQHVLKAAQALEGTTAELRVFLPDPLKGNDVTDLLDDCRSEAEAVDRLRACLVAYELRRRSPDVVHITENKRQQLLVDRVTGEVVEPLACPNCQSLQDQLDGAQREIRSWRARYAELDRTTQREAERSPWWPIAIRLFQAWQETTGHGRSAWTHDRFAQCEQLLMKYGPETVERAIAGIAFDPFVTTRRNGSKKRHDGWDLLFKNADKLEEYACRAPGGWHPTLDLRAPASTRRSSTAARRLAIVS